MRRTLLRFLGVFTWLAVAIGSYALIELSRDRHADASSGVSLVHYFAGPAAKVQAIDPSMNLRVHDPVFIKDPNGEWAQIGYVESTSAIAGVENNSVVLSWCSRNISPRQCQLIQYRNGGSLEDVVSTMLPEDMKQKIRERMTIVMNEHGAELSAAFMPLVQASMREALPVIEEELQVSIANHREDIEALSKKWNKELIDKRLIPLARKEIMPIVRKHGQPPAERIGRELWDRASIWRFGWRAAYDKSPLPRRHLLQQEWDRFVEREAIPIFRRHMNSVVKALQRIISDAAANKEVRRELAEVADLIASDPETQALVRDILKETFVDNERLREAWANVWKSQEARAAFDLAGERLEPVVREIADDLLGNDIDGINPNFARVLREQILEKDRRWIVAERRRSPSLSSIKVVDVSDEKMLYPIVHMADRTPEGGSDE
jgi:hypothetical protein